MSRLFLWLVIAATVILLTWSALRSGIRSHQVENLLASQAAESYRQPDIEEAIDRPALASAPDRGATEDIESPSLRETESTSSPESLEAFIEKVEAVLD